MTSEELQNILTSVGISTESYRPAESQVDGMSTATSNGVSTNGLPANNIKQTKRAANLEVVSLQSISVPPKNEHISYCKTTQTDDDRLYDDGSTGSLDSIEYEEEISMDENYHLPVSSDLSPTREVRRHLKALQFKQHLQSLPEAHGPPGSSGAAIQTKVPDLSDEERRHILNSQDFSRFFQHTTRIIERALAEDDDIFIDYINGPAHEEKTFNGEVLVLQRQLYDEKVTANRFVQALDFSSFYPELLAVAYDRNPQLPLASEGVVCVWNTKFKTPPEMTFHSTSRVTSLIFDSYQPNIIIGGCYSGQICIWDTRANKKNPVCKTQLSAGAHTQPIKCMKMVGTQNAHELITVSTDGKMCSWSVDNLAQPIDAVSLMCKSKRQITALSMCFFHSNINSFVIGSEEKNIYMGDRHGNKGEMTRSIEAHDMPITTVDLHRAAGTIDFSPLCLSGSMDFTVKLWNLKDAAQNNPPQPLLSFERKHKLYVVDVQWSPVHPAVFVTASVDGVLNLWNLNTDTEESIATVNVSGSITRVLWSKNGQQLTVSDDGGRVFLYAVHESLYNVRTSEWDDFAETLTELKLASSGEFYSASNTI
ncbi:cytoplasmic dynein 1 intermediate chain 2 domain-containing protein [Ditylenchus destructor]|uniref:Cytoplasmic dynein 1 intermediate chain 2 domain-containing protein n=1 Tax=Ditylenchus destructor TaxID=166010 RepID=A0AAD4N8H6_9BILA|nr:cytoplasmic dynein 1 intermediate chain 2 domain-containing protein [Ditylenchus destructor]